MAITKPGPNPNPPIVKPNPNQPPKPIKTGGK